MAEWIYKFWPLRIVSAWEQGVKLRAGNPTDLLTSTNGWHGSGLHFYWPVLGEIITADTASRVVETGWQSLVTKDGEGVSFSLAARYRIRDLVKLYTTIQDPDETIQNQLSAAASEALSTLNLDEIDAQLAAMVKKEARKQLTQWGVTLLEVSLFNRIEAQAIRLLSE